MSLMPSSADDSTSVGRPATSGSTGTSRRVSWASRTDRGRASPNATSPEVVEKILKIRKRRGWGGRKISARLERDPAVEDAPCPSTVTRVLNRHGCIKSSKPDRRRSHPGPPLPIKPEPNATWSADFKGEFRMGDANLCYPLTVQNGHSRFLLECRGMHGLDLQATRRRFGHLFREFGMPERIRTDNGHPFASRAIGRLSQLSVWWVSLGIIPDFIEPRLSRTAATSGCTGPSRREQLLRQGRTSGRSNGGSTASAGSITSTAPTRPSTCSPHPLSNALESAAAQGAAS